MKLCMQDVRETVYSSRAGTKIINFFSCSTRLSMKFIMHINVKMPTLVGILKFICMINTISESLKARKVFIFLHSSFFMNF